MQQKENIEYRTRNVECRSYMADGKNFIIRYSFRAYGKFIILELPTAKVLAKQLL